MHLNMSSAKWRPFCCGGDELTTWPLGGAAVILKNVIVKFMLQIQIMGISWELAPMWMFDVSWKW